jgi:EmrB/QacA subfamily drug resistance transporter
MAFPGDFVRGSLAAYAVVKEKQGNRLGGLRPPWIHALMSFRISRHNLLLGIVAAALFMQNLDSTVITTALPQMAVSFDTTPIHLSIGITAYMLSLAVFIPVSGWVADRFGSRTIFSAAIIVFTLGSVLCGLCNGVTEFALSRVFQGIGGAMMVPVGRLVLFRAVGKAGFVRALSYLTMSAMIGPVLGPPVGGFITTFASWRWIFYLNLPIGIVGAVLVWFFLENYREENSPSFDWIGFVATGVAIATLVLDCDFVVQPEASVALTVGLFLFSIASGAFAAWYMLRRAEPIVDLSLLRIPSFFTGVAAGGLFRVGAGGVSYLVAILLQVNMGMSAFASGLITIAAALSSLTMKMAIPHGSAGQRFHQCGCGRGVRDLRRNHAGLCRLSRLTDRRLLPLVAIHRSYDLGLCRHPQPPHQRRDQLFQHDATGHERHGRGGRRGALAFHAVRAE